MPTLILKGVYIGLIIIVIRIEMRGNIVTKYTVNVGGRQSGKTQKAIDMWMLNTDYKLYV